MTGTLLTLLPQLAARAHDFRRACWLFAGLLLAASVVGVLLGWFLLAPAALVLLAAGARSDLRPECLSTVLGGAVAFLALAGFGTMVFEQVAAPHFREPTAFTATVDGAPPPVVARERDGALTGIPTLGHGATAVFFHDEGGRREGRMTVQFSPDTPRAELDILRERIGALPGIHDVKPCDPSAGDCN
ncbi:hypothetical protein [Kitasatospora sp. NPDC007106]|uniref:hypothetical protein n=1 Tax=Kitasatospora sp. NPDC007106 TaxID=3156914 RepID=UPI0033D0C1C7